MELERAYKIAKVELGKLYNVESDRFYLTLYNNANQGLKKRQKSRNA